MKASVGMLTVKKAAKSLSWLASELGITRGAVSQWTRIPAERVLEIERLTGVPRHVQRPDIYPAPVSAPAATFASHSGHCVSPLAFEAEGAPSSTKGHVKATGSALPAGVR